LYEAKAFGADAILLIAAGLSSAQLNELFDEANANELEYLVEVHSEQEIESLNFDKVNLVGINNRDLSTFKTDLETSIRLKEFIPNHVHVVSESAIHHAADVQRLMNNGIGSFLIGETFMRAASPGDALRDLLRSVDGE
jgi:indole-3-glycerol phosphate synthase